MNRKWWKEGVVYQIYPRSFNDSNNDGIGDIKGIIEKIDYLKNLGVDIIWLNPVYASPNDDNGYDISDYRNIMSEFGTLEDLDKLLLELHKRDMKLIMDLVVNHTSDEHPWFIESRKSKENKYRDYYIWRKAKENGEPNNWKSFFSGPAWEYDEKTKEYYLHLFSKKQPDLNWENEDVRNEIYEMINWWLDRGIDGFRMDTINMLSKNQSFPDTKNVDESGYGLATEHFINGPKIHDYIKEMHEKTLKNRDVLTVGECPFTDSFEALKYVGEDRDELNMVFQMEHTDIDYGKNGDKWIIEDWKLTDLKQIMEDRKMIIDNGGWNSLYWMNHDQARAVSRFTNDREYRRESAKLLVSFLMTMPGTPFIYQGEEIGMTNIKFDTISDYRDIETLNFYNEEILKNEDEVKLMELINFRSRDNSRTPMQWDKSKNAGFTRGAPWINVNPNYKDINVEDELKNENSILNYYKEIISIRKNNLTLVYGEYELICRKDEKLYAYIRRDEENKYIILLNFSGEELKIKDKIDEKLYDEDLIMSNYKTIDKVNLMPYEARIYKLK